MAKTSDVTPETPTTPPNEAQVPATTRPDPLTELRKRQEARMRDLRSMTFEEAGKDLQEQGKLVDAARAGIGFKLVEHKEDKAHFVGVELMVLPGWTVTNSLKFVGQRFASFYVKTRFPIPQLEGYQDFIINDGSSGIAAQLAELRAENIRLNREEQGIYCRHGFQYNEYVVMDTLLDDDGNVVMDRELNKPKKTPRLDPVTNQTVMGGTYRLDISS